MSWTRVQYMDFARVQADAETSARWTTATMQYWLQYCFDDGWRRILNGAAAYRNHKLTMTADENGHIAIADINEEIAPDRFYRVLDPMTVRNWRLAQWGDVVLPAVVTGQVLNFQQPAANQPITFWVNSLPENPMTPISALYGDVNGDGVVDTNDLSQYTNYIFGLAIANQDAMTQNGNVIDNDPMPLPPLTDGQQLQVTAYYSQVGYFLNPSLFSSVTPNVTAQARIGNAIPGAPDNPGADTRPVDWPDGHELVLAQYISAFMLTKGAVESRASGDLFAVCDAMFTNMIQALMDRSTNHQQIIPADSSWDWSGGARW